MSEVLVAGSADWPVIRSPVIIRARREMSLTSALRFAEGGIPPEQESAEARALGVEWIAQLGGRPELPIGRAVSALFAVRKTQWLHFIDIRLSTKPCLRIVIITTP